MGSAAAYAVAWWILSAQALPGHALLRVEQGVELEPHGDLQPHKKFAADFIFKRNMEIFTLASGEIETEGSFPNAAQLIVGVWTRPDLKMYRDTVRNTWMAQRYVCPLSEGRKPGCQIYTTFVVGAPGQGRPLDGSEVMLHEDASSMHGDTRIETDMTVLATTEENKHRKIYDFFRKMAQENPWASHIAKIDQDAYIFVPKLLSRLYQQRDCRAEYEVIGVPGHCNKTDDGCDFADWLSKQCTMKDCTHYAQNFDFFYGQFMAVSRQLALKVTDPETSLMSKGTKLGMPEQEDHAFSRALVDAASADNSCIHFWDAEAVSHPRLPSGSPTW